MAKQVALTKGQIAVFEALIAEQKKMLQDYHSKAALKARARRVLSPPQYLQYCMAELKQTSPEIEVLVGLDMAEAEHSGLQFKETVPSQTSNVIRLFHR
jgi:hypothetical protein